MHREGEAARPNSLVGQVGVVFNILRWVESLLVAVYLRFYPAPSARFVEAFERVDQGRALRRASGITQDVGKSE